MDARLLRFVTQRSVEASGHNLGETVLWLGGGGIAAFVVGIILLVVGVFVLVAWAPPEKATPYG